MSLKIINSTVSEKIILQYINIFCSKMDEVSETFESKMSLQMNFYSSTSHYPSINQSLKLILVLNHDQSSIEMGKS